MYFTAEGVKIVYDFGRIFDHVSKPSCGPNAETIYQALTMFEHYYEMNEGFDHLTHGMGPGLVGIVVHAIMDFLGDLVNQEIDHSVKGPQKGTPLCVYVAKLKEIMNSVVTEDTEEGTGRLLKKEERVKTDAATASKPKSKVKTKQTERKHTEQTEPASENEEDDVVSIACSEDEQEFTTLTSTEGKSYHPPDKKLTMSRYSPRDAGTDINKKFEDIRSLMDKQQKKLDKQQETIARLTRENEMARGKLKKLPDDKKKKKKKKASSSSETKQQPLDGFVATQILSVIDSSSDESDEDVVEVNDKPDSTQKSVVSVDVHYSDAGSEVFTQVPRRRRRIESGNTSTIESTVEEDVLPIYGEVDTEDLIKKKEELEEKCKEMESKLLAQQMENSYRQFQQSVVQEIQHYRGALMAAFGTNIQQNASVLEARAALERACVGRQFMGYTIRVHEEFVDRVHKSLMCGQMPEKQMEASKTDNSVNDPILGTTVDVVYELIMPVVVKSEKFPHEDDDELQYLGETPAPQPPKQPFLNITVKSEPADGGSSQTQESQDSSPIFSDGHSAKTAEPATGDDSENKPEEKQPEEKQPEENQPEDSANKPEESDTEQNLDVETSSQTSKRSAEDTKDATPSKKRRNKNVSEVASAPGRVLRTRRK